MRTALAAIVAAAIPIAAIPADTNPNDVLERMRGRLERDCPEIAKDDLLRQCHAFVKTKARRGGPEWFECAGVAVQTQQRMKQARSATCRAALTVNSIEG